MAASVRKSAGRAVHSWQPLRPPAVWAQMLVCGWPPAVWAQMLAYGCTRLEVGLQSTYEDVARDTNRGHTVASVGGCFQLAKDAGFKVRRLRCQAWVLCRAGERCALAELPCGDCPGSVGLAGGYEHAC